MKLLYKYYLMIAVPLILCLLSIGITLSFQMYNYSLSDRHDLLLRATTKVSALTEEVYYSRSLMQEQVLKTIITSIVDDGKTHIVICDVNGQIFLTSDNYGSKYIGKYVNPDVLTLTDKQSEYSSIGALESLYNGETYTVGTAVRNHTNAPIAYVYATTSIDNIKRLMSYVTNLFFFLALIVFIIAALVSCFIVKHMTKPLKMISTASSSFARGDFSTRVPVLSNDEIGDMTIAFNNMADSLEKSEVLRRDFVANVSHELRSPMTSITGFIDGILDGTIPADRQEHYLKIVSDEVHRLSRLVSRMLDITVLQSTNIVAQSTVFNFSDFVSRVALNFEQRISERNITLNIEMPSEEIYIFANEDSIYQVVYNLIDNAVKFSEEDTPIDLLVSAKGNKVTFSVKNRGPEIPGDQLIYVFDRFHKADKSRSKDKSGLGLGLYIAKTIINQHKGKIRAESRDGVTEFSFMIPLRTTKPTSKPQYPQGGF